MLLVSALFRLLPSPCHTESLLNRVRAGNWVGQGAWKLQFLICSFLLKSSSCPRPFLYLDPLVLQAQLASLPLPDTVLMQPPFLLAASGHTDSLHLLIDSGERADITDVMDAHGQ
jgi:hypothetical protein